MARRVRWAVDTERDLRRLDYSVRERIRRAVYRLADHDLGDVKQLRGRNEEWRLRVGDWRILFTYQAEADQEEAVLLVLRVLHRSRAYRE